MTADTVGGVWTYAVELAGALAADGVEVVLATMGDAPSADQREHAAALPNVRLEASTFRLEWMEDPWEDVEAAGDWLLELERRERPDVVHLNGYAHGRLPFSAPVVVVGHSCVVSWWRAVRGGEAPAAWDRYRCAVRQGLRGADVVITPTAWMMERIEEHHGVPARGLVLHNGRSAAGFAPGPKRPVVLAAGRVWDEAKNLRTLAATAPRIGWPVEIAGERRGPDGREWDGEGVAALGRLNAGALAGRMAVAAIFAHPARYEPFGLAPLEAALSGCALVLGDIPSLREVWEDAAVYVEPDDAGALASAVNDLIADEGARERLAERALRRAARYTSERMGRAYAKVYRELAARGVKGEPERALGSLV